MLTATAFAAAQTSTPFTTAFPISEGAPFRVCAESPQVVWYTLPAENALGRLTLTAGAPATTAFPIPTLASDPYGITCGGGRVWLTERLGNRIASFDPASSTWTEYPIPTANSEPTGIDIQPNDPTEVWFVERAGNKVGRLRVTQQGTGTFDEYAPPPAWSGMSAEDIDVYAPGLAWFTAPGLELIARLDVTRSAPQFALAPAGAGSHPWNIAAGNGSNPWITDPQANVIGQYNQGTLGNFTWFAMPNPNSQPWAIATAGGRVWFTELAGQRAARLESGTSIRELSVPGAGLTGLSFDTNNCGWLADNAQRQLVRWCSPYFFSFLYLPQILK